MIVTIDLVDKSDAGFGVFVSTGDDSIPDVSSEHHTGLGSLLNLAVGQIGVEESLPIRKRDRAAVRKAIEQIVTFTNRVENRICPWFAVELELEPFVVVDRF